MDKQPKVIKSIVFPSYYAEYPEYLIDLTIWQNMKKYISTASFVKFSCITILGLTEHLNYSKKLNVI